MLSKNACASGVFSILFGGISAVLILLTRWPAVHLLGPESFYRALTFHGINMLIFWIIFFEIAVLYFAGPIVLSCRLAWPRMGWAAFGTGPRAGSGGVRLHQAIPTRRASRRAARA